MGFSVLLANVVILLLPFDKKSLPKNHTFFSSGLKKSRPDCFCPALFLIRITVACSKSGAFYLNLAYSNDSLVTFGNQHSI